MKKYTFKDFLDRKVDVRCNTEEQKEAFLKVCAKHRLLWNSGSDADKFIPYSDIITMKGFDNGRLGQSSFPYCEVCVNFDEIDLFPYSRYQITIDCDGDTTTAKMIVNGKEVKTATAKRNPADKANWRIGAQTAFDRLWKKQEKPEKQKVREVKRPAKPGEYIKFIKPIYHFGKVGDIAKVFMAWGDGALSVKECDLPRHSGCKVNENFDWFVERDKYVVLEGYKPGSDSK